MPTIAQQQRRPQPERSRLSPLAAIAAKCKDCVHDPAVPGTWRQQVALCTCTDCALWVHRPQPRIAPKHRAQPNGGGKTGANQTERLTPATPVPGSRPCAVP